MPLYQLSGNNIPFISVLSSKGYAYTFITEDQVRYAGDIIKALELSGSPVPPELEQLWASFKDQQKAVRGTNLRQSNLYV